jgi:hypothetical protein
MVANQINIMQKNLLAKGRRHALINLEGNSAANQNIFKNTGGLNIKSPRTMQAA